ncbi:hypothetical protein D3C77_545940 [compost metagenome]
MDLRQILHGIINRDNSCLFQLQAHGDELIPSFRELRNTCFLKKRLIVEPTAYPAVLRKGVGSSVLAQHWFIAVEHHIHERIVGQIDRVSAVDNFIAVLGSDHKNIRRGIRQ